MKRFDPAPDPDPAAIFQFQVSASSLQKKCLYVMFI